MPFFLFFITLFYRILFRIFLYHLLLSCSCCSFSSFICSSFLFWKICSSSFCSFFLFFIFKEKNSWYMMVYMCVTIMLLKFKEDVCRSMVSNLFRDIWRWCLLLWNGSIVTIYFVLFSLIITFCIPLRGRRMCFLWWYKMLEVWCISWSHTLYYHLVLPIYIKPITLHW